MLDFIRGLAKASAAVTIISLSPIGLGQRLSVRDNINSESFSHATPADKSVADAIIRSQLKQNPRKLDEIDEFEKDFLALPIQIASPTESDYVVMGTRDPFTGGDNDWFWIVRQLPSGPRVVLWLHCLNFDFDKRRTNGLLGVGSEWNSPNEEIDEKFRFNGQRYVRVAHRDKPMVWKQ